MVKLGYILLVDDSDNDLELTRRTLQQHKLANEFVELRDGAEALDFLYRRGNYTTRREGDPILILLDIKMPKIDGFEVLQRLKADPQKSAVPVVMLTSSREGPDVQRCYQLHANAFVVKPVDFEQFVEAVMTIGKFWAVLNEVPATAPEASG
jgi:CheY-like chemotaxis protein